MNLLDVLFDCAKKANCRTVIYQNLPWQGIESVIESYRAEEFPLMIIEQITNNGTYSSTTGMRDAVIPLTGFVVTRLKEDTVQYRMQKIEAGIVRPMGKIFKDFTRKIIASGIINPAGTVTDSFTGAYQVTNQHLFGVSFTISLPIIDSCL